MNIDAPPLRIYTDTSVIGGCFDEEFADASNQLFDGVRACRFKLLVSEVVAREIAAAPVRVQQVLTSLGPDQTEQVPIDERVVDLATAYLEAGVVGSRWFDDAIHVAAATVARADAIVSWNFKHIVRLDKIKAYNVVSEAKGFHSLTILSPTEVIEADDDHQD